MKIVYFYILLFLVSVACINEVEVPDIYKEELTVEAFVEKGKSPKVYLTTSLPLVGNENLDFIRAIQGNAKVEISDGNLTEIATFDVDDERYPNRYYRFANIIGEENKAYQLKITLDGLVYESETSIPKKPNILSISSLGVPEKDENYKFKILFENSNSPQYYKIFIKQEQESKFEEVDVFLVNNELFSGNEYEVYIDYLFLDLDGEEKSKLYKSYFYDIKIVAITKKEYSFWKALKGDDTINLINAPVILYEVPYSISNNAFGYFGGFNSEVIRAKIE